MGLLQITVDAIKQCITNWRDEMREDEHYQLELERMEQLEDAIERATQGVATEDDWNIIRFECGINQRPVLNTHLGK